MGVSITSNEHKVALFDNTTDMAFGPVFDHATQADKFCEYVAEEEPNKDIREIPDVTLMQYHAKFMETYYPETLP